MLAGFGGHLISEAFLQLELQSDRSASPLDPALFERWRRDVRRLGPASSVRAVFEAAAEPLVRLLGYREVHDVNLAGDGAIATLRGSAGPALLVVGGWGENLDGLWRSAVVEARRRGADWCVLFNGTKVRLLDARRLYARRHAEFDLGLAGGDERGLKAFALLFGAEARAGLPDLVARSERHASGVCRELRRGVLTASRELLGALIERPPRPDTGIAFEQALTVVYRILFLLFAEARGLVPIWHPVYRESYSVEALSADALAGEEATGLWDALRAMGRLAHAGCQAGDLRVTAFNGRLFAPSRTPLAERRDLDDRLARRAVVVLSTRPSPDGAGREPISYRDLGIEQLGSVYETLLDYEPKVTTVGPRLSVSLEPGSGLRKSTGTFYTPLALARYLVRRTLGPLVRDLTPERVLGLKVVDPAMGSGAFLVAACRFLAEAYQAALVRSGGCHPSDVGPREQAAIRRLVAERCLYGVDVNPMAVQLARLSLWLATLAADRPLTFLDHRLQTGDSLLGAWLSCLRQPPGGRPGRRSEGLQLFEATEFEPVARQTLPVRFALATPNDTVEQVREKERALAALTGDAGALSRWKRVADLWCAHFLADPAPPPSAFRALCDLLLGEESALPPRAAEHALDEVAAIARSRRLFHWELEFPEVFFEASGKRKADGGFDAVLSNPPWDVIRADAGSASDRRRSQLDARAVLRFTRGAGIYTARSDGHPNRYQLFTERAISLTRAGGRLGLVVPSGLTLDHGSAGVRRLLFSRAAVDAIVGFDNRKRVFPIHRSVRFLLLTATGGRPTTDIACRMGEQDPAVLEADDDQGETWFPVRVTPAVLRHLSGDELAVPDLRTPADLAIAERAAALFRPLGDPLGWGARFGRELNATEDRGHFSERRQGMRVIEGRHITPFRVGIERARWSVPTLVAGRLLGRRHLHQRLGYRDVAGATNRQTLIAAMLPAGCVSTHTVFCLRTTLPLRDQHLLCGLFNSYVVNYLARLRVTTHVTTAIVERLPVPAREAAPAACGEIAALARVLSRRPHPHALARLNARVAQIYQLSDDELAHVLDTFPLVPRGDRDAVLRELRRP